MRYGSLKNYDERGFAPPLKPGWYTLKVDAIKETNDDSEYLADKNGFKYVMFEFTVSGEPNRLFDRFYLNEEEYEYRNVNLGKFKQLVKACGFDSDEEGDTDKMLGKVVSADVVTKEYKGSTFNNVKEYKVAEGENFKETDDDLPF